MNYRRTFYVFISLFFLSTGIFAQAQLVQSFIEQNNRGDTKFGCSVSTAGDVNNDGYDDVIIGAPGYDVCTGRAYIFFGGSPMDSDADITMTGENHEDYFGKSVSNAGDVNNDGYDDVLIGADGYNFEKGRAYIYFGGSAMNSTADLVMTGDNEFGRSVSVAGDVNNDGFDDVIVNSKTAAYVYFGGNQMDNIADVVLSTEKRRDFYGLSVSSAGDVNNDGIDDIIIGSVNSYYIGTAYIYFGGNQMDNIADVILTGEDYNDYFSLSVSSAGDINNDGYDDVIIGAPYYQNYRGRSYIYYGGNPMDTVADIVITGDSTNNYFGYSVSTAGDINNDGFDDVIIGASEYKNTGGMYIFLGGSIIDTIADDIITGIDKNDWFGRSVSNAGDINNDGYDDIIIGAPFYPKKGGAFIYYGNNSLNNDVADVILVGEGQGNSFGYSVSTAGDVNNDGFDDIIVGAIRFANKGGAYIYYGGNPMDNIADVILTGENPKDYFGSSVSTAGDINNDGYDDVIIGAYKYHWFLGRAYVYYGGNPMDSVVDVIMTGESSSSQFGRSISNAGDVNNDGYDDVIIGALKEANKGRVYLYYGGNPMDTVSDVVITGESEFIQFGRSVSTARDVNNDGFDDVIVGAPWFTNGKEINSGRVYIFLGGTTMDNIPDFIITGDKAHRHFGYSVSTAGDINNDSYDDIIVGTGAFGSYETPGFVYVFYGSRSMDSISDVTITSNPPSNYYGCSVSTAGDINNDGYSDVIVGDYLFNTHTGRAFIYYGGNVPDSTADIILTGKETHDILGYSVSNAGDVNNDGYDDIIIGAPGYSVNGKVYIYSDSNATLPVEFEKQLPIQFVLEQNYPNPFNPVTTIKYSIPALEMLHSTSPLGIVVQLKVYDVLGKEIETLVNEKQNSGNYKVDFNASKLSSGIYFYRLQAGKFVISKKMLLLK